MASTFKTLLNDDVTNTRTLLHEAIPITGTILSGVYNAGDTDTNVKTYTHGMFKSMYDYPYLSSSANHIFDLTFGHSQNVSSSEPQITQNGKKLNVYNQMAQVLMGYDTGSNIRRFESDGVLDDDVNVMDRCFFMNFSRLLVKDEIKKGSFKLTYYEDANIIASASLGVTRTSPQTVQDLDATTEYRTSPAGDYGLLYTGSVPSDGPYQTRSIGLIFYQAGVVVLTASMFSNPNFQSASQAGTQKAEFGTWGANYTDGVESACKSASIESLVDAFRLRVDNVQFNNTIELNSAIYFCRANHNEFNYSANPTYVSGSKLKVKTNVTDLPISYITSVGLYSADNELLAVAKLSEPIRKDPNTELTMRVRLDY